MLGSKRLSFPGCAERERNKMIKDDANSIYETTLRKLLARSSANSNSFVSCELSEQAPSSSRTTESGTQVFCAADNPANLAAGESRSSGDLMSEKTTLDVAGDACCQNKNHDDLGCFHCRRNICMLCSRLCDGCQHTFCNICSIPNFSERYDRAFCLDCSANAKMTVLSMEV